MKNNYRKKKKIKLGQISLNLILILICMCFILPIWLMIAISLSGENSLEFTFFPKVLSTFAYEMVMQNPKQIIDAYGVTIFYSLTSVILSMIVMSLMAYALSRKNFKLRNQMTILLFISVLFGSGMVPSYIVCSGLLNLDNTIWIYILPTLVNCWSVIVLRTFFMNLPQELFESARIDGASEWRLCFQIAIPLSTPILATNAYQIFLNGWNDWSTSSIYIRKPEMFSLQYVLQRFMQSAELSQQLMSQGGIAASDAVTNIEVVRFAMAVMGVGPAILVFPFIQKYYDKGLIVGSVKG